MDTGLSLRRCRGASRGGRMDVLPSSIGGGVDEYLVGWTDLRISGCSWEQALQSLGETHPLGGRCCLTKSKRTSRTWLVLRFILARRLSVTFRGLVTVGG